jgi:hypothetical protein
MIGVLQGTYSFFLRQATGMAKLAEGQLAFERQEFPQNIIKADYWQSPSDNLPGSADQNQTDRKGLTGSARLLRDLTQLDQFAFTTDKRKLELTKTISLANMAPADFQRFRQTGEMIFATPMEMFDRDFPGHYLRLIKRVRTSVIALIPPNEGIKATLQNIGVTYTVIESSSNVFERIHIARPTESVALTGSSNATGLFELNQVQNEKLFPFENSGVDGRWSFSMPKAANHFDYDTIADVLLTIEYTALNSVDYRSEVIDNMDTQFTADRMFSFKNQFPDQWYDLNNSDQVAAPMNVSFTISSGDYPVNVLDPKIKNIAMYFIKSENLDDTGGYYDRVDALEVNALTYAPQGETAIPAFDPATAVKGRIHTLTNGSAWMDAIGKKACGTWELQLFNSDSTLFRDEYIQDILFVITYEGTPPEWPR